jgi:hypothetical protein
VYVLLAGYWKGTLVAVKTMMFPAAMSGKEKREKMAIMETAISASLSHPNIVQVGIPDHVKSMVDVHAIGRNAL